MSMAPALDAGEVRHDASRLGQDDLHWFNEGTHEALYRCLGAHPGRAGREEGTFFAVWAPNASAVSVAGAFNGWADGTHPLQPRGSSGIWEGFVPGVGPGTLYKYRIHGPHGVRLEKADPVGFLHETPPRTASVVAGLAYDWGDGDWMRDRGAQAARDAPMSVYELHLGSWKRPPDRPHFSYDEIAGPLVEHVLDTGFTHVELLPVMEHPFYGSWGYQTTGYFAPTSRYGTPQGLKRLIDTLHRNGIGVLLDWVPSHFPDDPHGLARFDGTHLYEHTDPRQGFHPDWRSHIFNYGRHEVRSFLISSALWWLDEYHADGLRVDAVASMLYLDYSRREGEWIPNEHGGRENLDAIRFLRGLNEAVYRHHPDAVTVAEESTAWPMVSRPTYLGGLGFGYKWDMGWMHDTLQYFAKEPVHRRYHQDGLTFRMLYAFTENYMLPLSHDEVVHGKGSLLAKMPGDDWQKAANLRLLYAYMFAQPGKKLLFMGSEWGPWKEWDHERSLEWTQTTEPPHEGILTLVRHLNRTYRTEPALHARDCEPAGFEWIDAADAASSVLSFLRTEGGKGVERDEATGDVLAVFNLTPVPRRNYRLGVPHGGRWDEIVNTDSAAYGGSGDGNLGGVEAVPVPCHGRPWSIVLTLPPLGGLYLRHGGPA